MKDSAIFVPVMRPDYPSKIFSDKRTRYCLRMQMLAADDFLQRP